MASMRTLTLLLALLLAVLALAGCGGTAQPAAAPALTGTTSPNLRLSPAAVIATGEPATVTVTGQDFSANTTVSVAGSSFTPVVESPTSMELPIPGQLLTQPGTVDIDVTPDATAAAAPESAQLVVLPTGTVAPTGNTQVAQYTQDLPPGASMRVEFGPDINYGLTTWSQGPISPNGGPVSILVAGMRASTTYHMHAVVTLADGAVIDGGDHTFTTGAVWDPLIPPFTVTTSGTPSPGVEQVDSVNKVQHGQAVITDLQGNVLWSYAYEPLSGWIFPYRLMANGNFIMVLSDYQTQSSIREVTLGDTIVQQVGLGTINAELKQQGADFQFGYLDHEVLPLPDGHVIILGTVEKTMDNLPGQSGPVTVLGNAIVDLDPNFVPVWSWNGFDHLDVNRHPMQFPDWLHANALMYTQGGNLLLSLRHQSWIIKIDYENGKGNGDVLWKLGYQGDFSLAGDDPSEWFYAQHMPTIVSQNGSEMTLAVFDDGNDRVMDPQGDICGTGTQAKCYSRAVLFTIDQQTMTAQLDWQYKPGYYSFWGGNTEVLPNGDVEFDMSEPFPNSAAAEVMEVTQTASPQIVWSMKYPQNMYRAYRLPSLYPGVQW